MFTYVVPYRGRYIVYQPLKKLAFLGNAATVNLIEQLAGSPGQARSSAQTKAASEAVDFLDRIGFFDDEPVVPVRLSSTAAYSPTVAVLFLTTSCSSRCVYCYASGGERRVEHLDFETGRHAIDIVCANAMKQGLESFTLSFHGGGEPTLARQALRHLVEYARGTPLQCRVSLTSNGLWSREDCAWIVENVDEIGLSFDGVQPVQDRQRPPESGGSSFARVWANIQALDRLRVAYGIRLTVTDWSLDRLVESIDLLCRETTSRSFQVEPAFSHGRAARDGVALTRMDEFAAAFLEAYDLARGHQRNLYYSGARPWVLSDSFCLSIQDSLIVTPDHHLTACYEVYGQEHRLWDDFLFGTLTDDQQLRVEPGKRERLIGRIKQRQLLCRDCFCFWHCAGDCPSKTFGPEPEGHLVFGSRCDLNRLITRELLARAIAESGGVWLGGSPGGADDHRRVECSEPQVPRLPRATRNGQGEQEEEER